MKFFKNKINIILLLPTFLMIAALLQWLTVIYYNNFPSNSAEGSAWGSIGDGFDIIFLSIFYLLCAVLGWAIIFLFYYRKK